MMYAIGEKGPMKLNCTIKQIPIISTNKEHPQYQLVVEGTGTHFECNRILKWLFSKKRKRQFGGE